VIITALKTVVPAAITFVVAIVVFFWLRKSLEKIKNYLKKE